MLRVIRLDCDVVEERKLLGPDQEKKQIVRRFVADRGITLLEGKRHSMRMDFGNIFSMYTPRKDLYIEKIYGYTIEPCEDGFKDVYISPFNENLNNEDEVEDKIMLITQRGFGDVKKFSGERIAGRYGDEGIFLLRDKDKICIGEKEFMAIQIDRNMYLVQLRS